MTQPVITHDVLKRTVMEYESEIEDGEDHATVIITEWPNNEGVDVEMDDSSADYFVMTYRQWQALKVAMKAHMDET